MADKDLVTTEVVDGVTILSFSANQVSLTESVMPLVSSAFLAAADADPPKVVLDMGNVAFFSSSFIEVMFRLWNRINKCENSGFAISGLNAYCKEILEVTNLTTVWNVYSTRDEAVAALRDA
ncbi:MAG: STAS domain-containing protein [Planctomycetaceae bacterium]|nr:STAS domain-containing protein [Planctomycetaceae bacterium]MCB9953535.1 STAS domain-containing protein [Planctomycetaceae bacterium]